MKGPSMVALTTALMIGSLQADEGQDARPAFGLSDRVVVAAPAPETRGKLDRQAASGAAAESEQSVQAYVDSQERIAETFRQPIPERIAEKTRGER